jgi:cation transport regulator ChaC
MNKQHDIVGYGSLINSASRRITGIAGDSLAVRVQGLERTWVGWKGTNMRAVAARPMLGASCNGVLFEVPECELDKFDDRETHYVRSQLDLSQVDYLQGHQALAGNSQVWVYLYNHHNQGLQSAPIVQSYLDVILLGCQEIAPTFAQEFIEHTLNWNVWHDDRLQPVYPRAQSHSEAVQLDQLLALLLPQAFTQRCLAP